MLSSLPSPWGYTYFLCSRVPGMMTIFCVATSNVVVVSDGTTQKMTPENTDLSCRSR